MLNAKINNNMGQQANEAGASVRKESTLAPERSWRNARQLVKAEGGPSGRLSFVFSTLLFRIFHHRYKSLMQAGVVS